MNNQKNVEKIRQIKINILYLLVAISFALLTFVAGIFVGKKLTPQDSVKDLENQLNQTNQKDQFTFLYTLPGRYPDMGLYQNSSVRPSSRRKEEKDRSSKTKPQNGNPKDNLKLADKPKQCNPSPPQPILSQSKKTDLNKKISGALPPEEYAIQLSAFRTKDEAQELINILKNKGYLAHFSKVDLPEKGIWHRVRIGQFKSRQEAEKYLQTLYEKTGFKGFVTESTK